MSETYSELNQAITTLVSTINETVGRLNLFENGFKWFEAQRRYPMEPQPIMPGENAIVHEWYTSNVTVYGGAHKPERGVDPERFAFGVLRGSIAEGLPAGDTHKASHNDVPVPYIRHGLAVTATEVKVDAPFADRDEALREGHGIILHEGVSGFDGRSRVATIYKRDTQELVAVTGSSQRFNAASRLEDAREYMTLEAGSSIAVGRLALMQRLLTEAAGVLTDVQARGDFLRPPGTAYCTF